MISDEVFNQNFSELPCSMPEGPLLTSVSQPDIGKKVLEQNDIPVMDCQALSPIMFPVEHVWDMLKQRIC